MIFQWLLFPLVIFYQSLFELINYFIHSYGWSLLLLSFATTIITKPINSYIEEIVDRERTIKNILSPQIEKINKQYKGRIRHEAISRLYYRYRYHPLLAIRSSLGLFVQLPFLLGAYWMLSDYSPLKEESFLFIKDLFLADGLGPFNINILPICMTLVNIYTIYISFDQQKERNQLTVIAIIFFILLYSAPSSLLLYWTTNNLLSLSKALQNRRKKNVYL